MTSSDASSRGILTMAFGDALYKEQAVALGLSLELNYPSCARAIITDDPSYFEGLFQVIPLVPEYGSNMWQKLHLNLYSPFDRTLYIDGDCLVIRDLDEIWGRFSMTSFGVSGGAARSSGQWLGGDLEAVRNELGIEGKVPMFNGGLLYWTRTVKSDAIFSRAIALADRYDSLGFGNAGGRRWHMSDEPLFALAMAERGLAGLGDEGGTPMATMIGMRGPLRIDVINNVCQFYKWHDDRVNLKRPAIAHFAGQYTRSMYYRRERARLRWQFSGSRILCNVVSPGIRMLTDGPLGVAAVIRQFLHRFGKSARDSRFLEKLSSVIGRSKAPSIY